MQANQGDVSNFRKSDLQAGMVAGTSGTVSVPMKHKMGVAEIELRTVTYYAIAESNNGTSTITRTTDTNESVTASSTFDSSGSYHVPLRKESTALYYAVVPTGTKETQFNSTSGVDQWASAYTATGIASGGLGHYDAYSTRVGTSTYSGSFSFSGTYLTFTVPFTGTYTIECWGASGGTHNSYNFDGKGGYVKGSISMTKDNKYYIYVGQQGNNNGTGGWNGGGSEKSSTEAAGGGGATDVRIATGNFYSRIIVAGGGGGLNYYKDWGAGSKAGDGGGLRGPIFYSRSNNAITNYGGTQTDGGSPLTSTNGSEQTGDSGSFGIGGNGHWGSGGGGWYGGSGGSNTPKPRSGSGSGGEIAGGGGSSFISGHPGCVSHASYRGSATNIVKYNNVEYIFSSTQMIDGSGKEWTTTNSNQTAGDKTTTMPTPPGGTISGGNVGNGYCRITGTSATP